MTRKNQLRRSGTRLRKHGALWLRQTRDAGETFFRETRSAGVTFVGDFRAASEALASSTGRSTRALHGALHKELLDWGNLVLHTREAYAMALQQRLDGVGQQARGARDALKLGAAEVTLLQSTSALLERAQERVDERLKRAAAPSRSVASKTARKAKGAKKDQTPLHNYDELTAKDLVSKVQRLSGPQASAVLDYELARKKRATVIRAVEQRLAAAS